MRDRNTAREVAAEATREWLVERVRLFVGGRSNKVQAEAEVTLMRALDALVDALDAPDGAPTCDAIAPAAAERAQIVAWLRKLSEHYTNRLMYDFRAVSDAIERGEHKPQEPIDPATKKA